MSKLAKQGLAAAKKGAEEALADLNGGASAKELVGAEAEKPLNEVVVQLLGGRGLPIMDKNFLSKGGSSDPCCKVSIGEKSFTSKTVPKSLAPRWEEEFRFPCDDPREVLHFVVEDVDK